MDREASIAVRHLLVVSFDEGFRLIFNGRERTVDILNYVLVPIVLIACDEDVRHHFSSVGQGRRFRLTAFLTVAAGSMTFSMTGAGVTGAMVTGAMVTGTVT
jgi:hypothetical protein